MSTKSSGEMRASENSKLLVRWSDVNGDSFTERSETHDISESGISFFLNSPIWLDTHLTITIASSELFGRLQTKTAKVVRLQTTPSGSQLVGARFDE